MTEIELSPDEERAKVHELCKNYLSGIWNDISEDQIQISKFDKGFASKIMLCEVRTEGLSINQYNLKKNEFNPIVIKFIPNEEFLKKPMNIKVIVLLMSEKKLSPKVLGLFPDGIIFEYIDGRLYNYKDDYNDLMVELLAQKLANIHSSNIPIEKDGREFYFGVLFGFFCTDDDTNKLSAKEAQDCKEMMESYRYGKMRKYFEEKNATNLLSIDLEAELFWIKRVMDSMNSPIVFSHNDFNRGNVIIRGNDKQDINSSDMFIIDFDYSCYTYRGVDIGRYFSCWRMESDFGKGEYPTDQQMSVFINAYIRENVKINGKSYAEKEINSRENIIKEAKSFTLFAYMIDIVFCVWMIHSEVRPPVSLFLEFAETRSSGYVQLKQKFLNEISIPFI